MHSSHTLRILSAIRTQTVLLKLALTKRKRSEKDDKTHLVDKVVVSNSVQMTSAYARGLHFVFVQFVVDLQMEAIGFRS